MTVRLLVHAHIRDLEAHGYEQVGRRRRGGLVVACRYRRRPRGGLVVACRWDAAAAAHMSMGGIAKAVYWKCTLSRPHSFFISLHPIILFLSFSHSYNYFDNIIHTLNELQVSRCLLTRLY